MTRAAGRTGRGVRAGPVPSVEAMLLKPSGVPMRPDSVQQPVLLHTASFKVLHSDTVCDTCFTLRQMQSFSWGRATLGATLSGRDCKVQVLGVRGVHRNVCVDL